MKQQPDLQKIQEEMQPGSLSAAGFLGTDLRNLNDIIRADQASVDKMGLSHETIAAAMRVLSDAAITGLGRPVDCAGHFIVIAEEFMGKIACPFRDNHRAVKRTITASNRNTGQTISWTDLSMHMIGRHGFYEGLGSLYRNDPAVLARFLDLTVDDS
ncbi:MAG: hypothetical protein ACYC5K_04600 [Saccharofermentanales bacterium]